MTPKRDAYLLARRETIRVVRIASAVALALVVLAELVVERHPHFEIDRPFGFYAWFGFGACVAMVLLARLIGRILKRADDYYRD
ncbi:MAG TPA: hypothetical protein VMM85_01620 [Methylomirabilota bacterium]|nr:hypothetical protein [Methylomirabilota bacterium]